MDSQKKEIDLAAVVEELTNDPIRLKKVREAIAGAIVDCHTSYLMSPYYMDRNDDLLIRINDSFDRIDRRSLRRATTGQLGNWQAGKL